MSIQTSLILWQLPSNKLFFFSWFLWYSWTWANSDFRISSFQVVDLWRILQFIRKIEKYFEEFIWFFFCQREGAATLRLPCLRYGSHYLEVEVCQQWTLLRGGVRVCGIVVLGYFWWGVLVIFISNYGIAVFRVQAVTPSQLFCLTRDPVTRIRVFRFL